MARILRGVTAIIDGLGVLGSIVYAFVMISKGLLGLGLLYLIGGPIGIFVASLPIYAFCELCDNVEDISIKVGSQKIILPSNSNDANNVIVSAKSQKISSNKNSETLKKELETLEETVNFSKNEEAQKLKEKYLKCQISEQEYKDKLKELGIK